MPRSRQFDEEQALDKAIGLFWRQGYEGTSLSDLTEAMGINRPSLYAAFGNKEQLFERALDRYVNGHGVDMNAALSLPTAREGVEALLRFYADAPAVPGRPLGCLLVHGALACSAESKPVKVSLSKVRQAGLAALRKRFERARKEGEPLGHARPADLARYVWTVLHGMAIAATDGATKPELRRTAKLAMAAWPESPEG